MTRRSTRRFLIVALSGFAINEASVLILTYQFAVAHRVAILVTLVGVAALLYLSSKFWAYQGTRFVSAPVLAGDVSLKPSPAARRP